MLDILVQSRRSKKAAKKFFRKLLKGLQYVPRVIITVPGDGTSYVLFNNVRMREDATRFQELVRLKGEGRN